MIKNCARSEMRTVGLSVIESCYMSCSGFEVCKIGLRQFARLVLSCATHIRYIT